MKHSNGINSVVSDYGKKRKFLDRKKFPETIALMKELRQLEIAKAMVEKLMSQIQKDLEKQKGGRHSSQL